MESREINNTGQVTLIKKGFFYYIFKLISFPFIIIFKILNYVFSYAKTNILLINDGYKDNERFKKFNTYIMKKQEEEIL